jgi:hypothetical protein
MKNRQYLMALILMFWSYRPLLGDDLDETLPSDSYFIVADLSFGINQISVDFSRDYPASKTLARFQPSTKWNPNFSYRHLFSDRWMAAIGGGYKSFIFKESESSKELIFLVLSHEMFRLIRLYDPFFLKIGGKIQYLAPIQERKIPSERAPEAESEVGGAVSLGILTRVSKSWLFDARVDRWRGTKTTKYQAVQVAFGFSFDGL